jgi:hypothetical protein
LQRELWKIIVSTISRKNAILRHGRSYINHDYEILNACAILPQYKSNKEGGENEEMRNIESKVVATLIAAALTVPGCAKKEKDFVDCINGKPYTNSATLEVPYGRQTRINMRPGYLNLTSKSGGMIVESNLNDIPLIMPVEHLIEHSTAEPGIYVPEGPVVLKDYQKTVQITDAKRGMDNNSTVVFVNAECKNANK